MNNENGPAGIAKAITKTLTKRMWTGKQGKWIETRDIIIQAINTQTTNPCCQQTIQEAFTLPLNPNNYTHYTDNPNCPPLPASPQSAFRPENSSWTKWEWDEKALAVIENKYSEATNAMQEYLYDQDEDIDYDVDPPNPTGMVYCGCDVCERRETFVILMPLFLDAYLQGHIWLANEPA